MPPLPDTTPGPFPAELADRRQWLVWRFVQKPGQKKPSKMPYYATTGMLRGWPLGKPKDGTPTEQQPQVDQGHELDREHLVDHDTAQAFAARHHFDGVGFAFLPGDGLIGIDLDEIDLDEARSARAASIIKACATWCEWSPSGRGVHLIGLGDSHTAKSNDIGVELFVGRQFFTMTGNTHPASADDVRPIGAAALEKLHRTIQKAKDDAKPAQPPAPAPGTTAAHNADASRYCLAALESAVQRMRGAGEGTRNDTLNAEVYGLAQLIHTGGISEATIRAALTDAAIAAGLPPGEVTATVRSAIEGGQRNPRVLPERQHPARRRRSAAPTPAQQQVDPETGEILEAPPAANDNAAPADFGRPIDLFAVQPPPPLDYGMLPAALVPYVRDQAGLTGCDPGIIGLATLVSAAACIDDGIRLQPKRHDPTWTESARLWFAVVGDPSTKKSPAISKAVRHVKRIDHRMAEDNAAAFGDWKWQHDSWKEAKKADKSNPPPEPEKPPMKRLMVEDITVEALTDVLKDNPRGVLTLKDELTGWFASMDAYRGGAKGASMDRAHWLEAYNGGRRSIDRVTRGSIVVPNWSTCIIGGVQPDMIRRVASSMGNDGLLQRFMVLVARPATLDEDRVPDMKAMDDFGLLFDKLAALRPTPETVKLSEAAHQCRERIARHAKRLIDALDHPHLQAWLGKWDGLFSRLLLLYHVIDCATHGVFPTNEIVSGETADQVERLMTGLLLHHAIHFYVEILDANERQDHIRQLARLILAKGWQKVSKRDIAQSWKASRKLEAWELRTVVDALCVSDWLTPDEVDVGSDGKARSWFVNPAVHAMFQDAASRERTRRQDAADVLRSLREAYGEGS